jgi:hypothetical protein
VSGRELKAALAADLQSRLVSASPDAVTLLLRAGELECAVGDLTGQCSPLERITDALAALVIDASAVTCLSEVLLELAAVEVPELVSVTSPEGFAYYALHPVAFAEILNKSGTLPAAAMVVGIRSIGTTLSAVTTAALRRRGVPAERMTVRPAGHPYDRKTEFSASQKEIIRQKGAHGAQFLIVDEGPGLSGSSFLSVAEALVACGIPEQQIRILCGHEPPIDSLRADNGPQRWRRFQHVAAASAPRLPSKAEGAAFMGGGEWRKRFWPDESQWPASWVSFERLKFLDDREAPRLFKFAGLGHYGTPVLERERAVAAAGFGPEPRLEGSGFVSCSWIQGRPMQPQDLSEKALARLADYCAFRMRAFPASCCDLAGLQEMATHDLQELELADGVDLRLERPVFCDGKMQPHEWLLTPSGQMWKTDSGSHGDDHFFPGPTDIAWDLAGAIVEWHMDAGTTERFLEMYRLASGDNAAARVSDFVRAYTVFRCAYCLMAANALQGSQEQARFERAAQAYRLRAAR